VTPVDLRHTTLPDRTTAQCARLAGARPPLRSAAGRAPRPAGAFRIGLFAALLCGASISAAATDPERFLRGPWSSEAPDTTYAVASADVDLDGDLDLVCANDG